MCAYVDECASVRISAFIVIAAWQALSQAPTDQYSEGHCYAIFFAFFPHSLVEWNMKITAFLQKAPLLQQLCYSGNSGNSTVPALCTSVVLRLKNLCAVFQCCWLLHVFAARLRWVADIYFVVVCCCCCYFFFYRCCSLCLPKRSVSWALVRIHIQLHRLNAVYLCQVA